MAASASSCSSHAASRRPHTRLDVASFSTCTRTPQSHAGGPPRASGDGLRSLLSPFTDSCTSVTSIPPVLLNRSICNTPCHHALTILWVGHTTRALQAAQQRSRRSEQCGSGFWVGTCSRAHPQHREGVPASLRKLHTRNVCCALWHTSTPVFSGAVPLGVDSRDGGCMGGGWRRCSAPHPHLPPNTHTHTHTHTHAFAPRQPHALHSCWGCILSLKHAACLHACLLACLLVCLPTCLPACQPPPHSLHCMRSPVR